MTRHRVVQETLEHVKSRDSRGLILFAGAMGTGRALAAESLAAQLGRELLRVDLSTVVSKYIGETEKNLNRVFESAERSNLVLLFDEADALFGKRTEIRDSHDRYANQEVSYFLRRVESFPGVVILTSNSRKNLDTALLRQVSLVVELPTPKPAR